MAIDRPGYEPKQNSADTVEERELTPPNEAEVMAIFRELTEGKDFTVTRKIEDEKGLYLLEMELPDADGEKKEYLYVRKGPIPEAFANDGQFRMTPAVETEIHVAFYDSDGIPYGGDSVKRCDREGNWRSFK